MSEILMQDLGVKHVMAKFVLQFLLPKQKEHRAAVANELIQIANNESDFLKKVITCLLYTSDAADDPRVV